MGRNILLVIDVQRAFIHGDAGVHLTKQLKRLMNYKWDEVIQTIWCSTGSNNFTRNLNYHVAPAKDAVVVKFKKAVIVNRENTYSCLTPKVVAEINKADTIYICGAETDACVLATCFDLWDNDYTFKIIEDAVISSNEAAHNGALEVMRRNFGSHSLLRLDAILNM